MVAVNIVGHQAIQIFGPSLVYLALVVSGGSHCLHRSIFWF
jgi:hypothetical protein